MAKHPHKLILMERRTWKCAIEGCSFFVHLGLQHVLLGKQALCSECGEQFTITARALQEDMPRCEICRSGHVAYNDAEIEKYQQEQMEKMKQSQENDQIEVIEADEVHAPDCEVYNGGECTCEASRL